jgi:hypothetical protein
MTIDRAKLESRLYVAGLAAAALALLLLRL